MVMMLRVRTRNPFCRCDGEVRRVHHHTSTALLPSVRPPPGHLLPASVIARRAQTNKQTHTHTYALDNTMSNSVLNTMLSGSIA